jgi:hypothetical protein
MIRGRRSAFLALVLAASPVSCGRSDGPPLYPVHGKVMFKGQPAAGATVFLRREGPPPPGTEALGPLVPSGQVDDQGNFSIRLDQFGDGAPVGDYKALVAWRVKYDGNLSDFAPVSSKKKAKKKLVDDKPDMIPDRLGERFMKPETSPFPVQVKAEKNDLQPFDVTK